MFWVKVSCGTTLEIKDEGAGGGYRPHGTRLVESGVVGRCHRRTVVGAGTVVDSDRVSEGTFDL